MSVYKTPWCGCCEAWVEAMKDAGYAVTVQDLEDLTQIKKQAEVSPDLEGCHTAVLDGERQYVLEGHVPLDAIDKLLREEPDMRGIAAPGMPAGSLGMGDDSDAEYNVYAFTGSSADTPQLFYQAGRD
ncbi:DUF411 domain-containing protein [Notoacmeibacter ruber]|uniref:DUF411 domain-containing protein n=1 Tax=Notoacmeibacter ruber TaxID=2670375 RepID=A0A3L7JAH3_9HYPH|nr:DUF411 domain-containing protein [Notoacmeibacter ruber]RLQ87355.1 DUF411 domain-containing protein [Notoacmeibacter ruber]